jgi:hypothetical protein
LAKPIPKHLEEKILKKYDYPREDSKPVPVFKISMFTKGDEELNKKKPERSLNRNQVENRLPLQKK